MTTPQRHRDRRISAEDAYGCVDWFEYDAHPPKARDAADPRRQAQRPDAGRKAGGRDAGGEGNAAQARQPAPAGDPTGSAKPRTPRG